MQTTERMPVFFIGHGNPMNAIEDNTFARALQAMGKAVIPRPNAILVVSAHWLTRDVYTSTTPGSSLIYDFRGFPEELFQVEYPAPGAPDYAEYLMQLIPGVFLNAIRGLDHGAWAILKHLFPEADIPVFQLSIAFRQTMQFHVDLGKQLLPLRDNGVLIIGSGNIVHNLDLWFGRDDMRPYEWAIEFDEWVKDKINKRDIQSLVNYEQAGIVAKLSVPTVDHYVPLLYAMALAGEREEIVYTHEEVFTSASMRSFRIG